MSATNWAGNLTYGAATVHHPTTVSQVSELVRRLPKLRVLGSRHSFNDVADTTGDHLALDRLPRTLEVDREAGTVTVDGGMRYGDLCGPLEQAGFALHNMASLPHISVAGACATATHGSGDLSGNLATAVRAMEVVTADGDLVEFSRDRTPDEFDGAVVSLGALGVLTRITLAVGPTLRMRQDVYENLALDQLAERFDEIASSADSVSLFTTWRGPTFEQLWFKQRVTDDAVLQAPLERYGATRATTALHPIASLPATPVTEQLGVVGAWHERMPHFRMEFTPSSGAELQTEYFVPRRHAFAALTALQGIGDRLAPLVQVSEVRTIAADELWLSPCYRQASVALHFTWLPEWAPVQRVLPLVEEVLAPFEPRPHWGKLFTMPPADVRSRYERLPDFRDLVQRHDPTGKFCNDFLERMIFSGDA